MSEVSDIIDSQYQSYYSSDINFWDEDESPSLWRGRSLYAFDDNIYAQKP